MKLLFGGLVHLVLPEDGVESCQVWEVRGVALAEAGGRALAKPSREKNVWKINCQIHLEIGIESETEMNDFFSTDINASYAFFLHALRAMLVCTKDRKCKSSLSTWERLNVRNYRKLIRKIIVRKWGQFVISFGMCCSESISEHLERRGYLEFRS